MVDLAVAAAASPPEWSPVAAIPARFRAARMGDTPLRPPRQFGIGVERSAMCRIPEGKGLRVAPGIHVIASDHFICPFEAQVGGHPPVLIGDAPVGRFVSVGSCQQRAQSQ